MPAILNVEGVCKSMGAVVAAQDLNIAIEGDTTVALIGSNGAGKTTFVNMVTGYVKPDQGTISYSGRDITKLSPRQITQLGICRSFQTPQLFGRLSVCDNLLVGLEIAAHNDRGRGIGLAPIAGEVVDDLLVRFGLTDCRHHLAGVLPEGERKLLDIAMTLAGRPKLALLDEPTSGVNADEKFGVMDRVIRALTDAGVTVVFVEHDLDIVRRYASRVLAFRDGSIIADGATDDVLGDESVRQYITGEKSPAGRTR